MALIAIGVAAFLLIRTEQQIGERALALRAFDRHAREASDALAEVRVAQHGYVAAGQGEAFWMSKVTATTELANAALSALRQTATAGGRTAIDEATETAGEFSNIDARIREYMTSGQQLMAADMISPRAAMPPRRRGDRWKPRGWPSTRPSTAIWPRSAGRRRSRSAPRPAWCLDRAPADTDPPDARRRGRARSRAVALDRALRGRRGGDAGATRDRLSDLGKAVQGGRRSGHRLRPGPRPRGVDADPQPRRRPARRQRADGLDGKRGGREFCARSWRTATAARCSTACRRWRDWPTMPPRRRIAPARCRSCWRARGSRAARWLRRFSPPTAASARCPRRSAAAAKPRSWSRRSPPFSLPPGRRPRRRARGDGRGAEGRVARHRRPTLGSRLLAIHLFRPSR